MLIINADDLGRSRQETDAAMDCFARGSITSATAMVFMEDSERAANLAKDTALGIGLHLNLSEAFTGNHHSELIAKDLQWIRRFLKGSRYALVLYNPFLREAFRRIYQAQVEEFERLYGRPPTHVDGHQHMHLCANMLFDRIIPPGKKVRRNFSFVRGEKGLVNRTYRRFVDALLARRYRMTDFFFSLGQCLEAKNLDRIPELAKTATVELMTHPIKGGELDFLTSEAYVSLSRGLRLGAYSEL